MAAEEIETDADRQTVQSPSDCFPPPSRQETYETFGTIETAQLPPPTIQQTRTVGTVGSTIRRRNEKGFVPKVKRIWAKYGPDLDVPTLLTMGKGGLPPTIAIAMYQSTAVAHQYTTLGYLMAIVSVLGFAIMPRAKFMQTMLLNLIATCFATAMNLLMMYCTVKAREHTTPVTLGAAGSSGTYTYNSSASAVSAIWLFFQVYLVNMMRAKYAPTLQFPSIIYTIFVVVASSYSPQFSTMTQAISFARRLLLVFLTGFGLATGVSLFILPLTSRKVVFKEMTGYIGALRGSLHAHSSYFQSLEIKDMFYRVSTGLSGDKQRQPEAQAVKKSVAAIQAMQGKLSGDLPFAKREIAWGHLGPDDLQEMSRLLRAVMLPLSGLSSVVDIFERLAELNGIDEQGLGDEVLEIGARNDQRRRMVEDWNLVMKAVHEPFQSVIQAMDEGLEHVLLRLKLKKPPKKKAADSSSSENVDVEGKADRSQPGEDGFAEYLESKSDQFYSCKELALKEWCRRKGIDVPDDYFKRPCDYNIDEHRKDEDDDSYTRTQRSLYALLYIEYLLYSTSRAVVEFVRFADERVKSGKLERKHLIMPGYKRWKKWLVTCLTDEDAENGADSGMGDINGANIEVNMGEAYKRKKDPEHLPPDNFVERLGDRVRKIPAFLRSPESTFGFRVACATMSIAIISFLEQTQVFFVQQRLLWAMIMVAISMVPTAGQSIFSFILRVTGTVIAMCASFIVWYIVDEHTPGIIVFYWLFASSGFYIILKKPRFVIVGMISIVTLTMIIGYELEVRKIGRAVASSNGQPYYEIYKLAPYRLATVVGGLAVAFIWTFFPYPISEHSELRSKMGASLYLLANYYSIVHETFRARVRGDEGDPTLKTSAGRRMTKARLKVFQKQLMLTANLRAMADFQKWEVPIGGKFPREKYDIILTCVDNMIRYMALVAFASQTFNNPQDASQTMWNDDFRRLIASVNLTSHEITSLLTLLSAAVTNGSPLPPYLRAPAPYRLSRRLEELDRDILSLRHVAEPGYAAFAVIQIATRCIIRDLEKLLKHVKELVGELDFSFHAVTTAESSRNNSFYPDPLSRRTTRTGVDTGDDDEEESDKED